MPLALNMTATVVNKLFQGTQKVRANVLRLGEHRQGNFKCTMTTWHTKTLISDVVSKK